MKITKKDSRSKHEINIESYLTKKQTYRENVEEIYIKNQYMCEKKETKSKRIPKRYCEAKKSA